MTTILRALSRRIRLAIHRHDPIECWCNTPAVQTGCVYCTSWNGEPHDPWCPRVREVAR